MNMEQLKKYILSILIDNADKLAIAPELTIDRLFGRLSVRDAIEIDGWRAMGRSDAYQVIWDRHLLPILAQADMNVKVFARD